MNTQFSNTTGQEIATNPDEIVLGAGLTASYDGEKMTIANDASFKAVLAGKLTMGGGAASEAETVTGLLATDYVFATITDNASNDNVILIEAKPSTNTLTLLFNEDPGAAVVVDYIAFRANA